MKRTIAPIIVSALLIGMFAAGAAAQTVGQCTRTGVANQWPNPTIVSFDTGSTKIRPEDAKRIVDAAKLAKANYIQQVCVTGFADKQGDAKKNEELSLRRAQVVANELVKSGVNAATIVMQAKGEPGGSIFSGANIKTQADRRVEVTFTR
ncbi:MAG: OmpA family protein [Proteobacteria bacterium]|nr:OmpA family protein [Pseudomonadota bacterium]